MKRAYDYPYYYEMALSSLRNMKKDVDFLQACAKKYSKIKVRSMLEIGCGNSPYLAEIARRGYLFVGLDLNRKMLRYSEEKAKKLGFKIKTVRADMLDFRLKKKVDFCFVLFGSIYRRSNQDFLRHLNCVSKSLKKGGLYVMHMVVEGNWEEFEGKWTDYSRRGKISTSATYERKIVDFSKQLRKENLTLAITDGKKKIRLFESNLEKFILPQEFRLLIEKSDFEFVDWFDGFNLNRKFDDSKKAEFLVCVIRKK